MRPKDVCLCLILILASSWTCRLAMGKFSIAPGRGNASFGQETYPLSVEKRAEIRKAFEAPPLVRLRSGPFAIALAGPVAAWAALEEVTPHSASSADFRHILMSLQP
jgi:hypothetical protein